MQFIMHALSHAIIAQVQEQDNSTATPAQIASNELFGRLVHDGSLVLYWANETEGAASACTFWSAAHWWSVESGHF